SVSAAPFKSLLHLAVAECSILRSALHRVRHPGGRESGDRLEATFGGCGARLHDAGQPPVECRHGDSGHRQAVAGHLAQDVEIALDQRRFGDDRYRMAKLAQYLEDRSRDAELAFDRLVGVGVAAERDRAADISFLDWKSVV